MTASLDEHPRYELARLLLRSHDVAVVPVQVGHMLGRLADRMNEMVRRTQGLSFRVRLIGSDRTCFASSHTHAIAARSYCGFRLLYSLADAQAGACGGPPARFACLTTNRLARFQPRGVSSEPTRSE